MGKLERPRHTTRFTTVVSTLVLVWAGISTLAYAIGTLRLVMLEPGPNPTLQAWLYQSDDRPGPMLIFLMEHPLIPELMLLMLFVVLTAAAYGTFRRRNRDRQLLCLGLPLFIVFRGYNVYLATATEFTPKSAGDRADVFFSIVDVVLSLTVIAFFMWERTRAEFDDSRFFLLDKIRRQTVRVASDLRKPAAQATTKAAEAMAGGAAYLRLLQLLLAVNFTLLTVAAIGKGGVIFLSFAVWCAAIFALTWVDDYVTSSLLSLPLGVFGVFVSIASIEGNWLQLPAMNPAAGRIYMVASALLALVAAMTFWFRPRPLPKPGEHVPPVERPALLVTAVGRAILIVATTVAVKSAPIVIGALSTWQEGRRGLSSVQWLRYYPISYLLVSFPRAVAIGVLLFWGVVTWAAIALLQRRTLGATLLQVAALIEAAVQTINTVSNLVFGLSRSPGYWRSIALAQGASFFAAVAAVALLIFLRSASVRQELARGAERAVPPYATGNGVPAVLRTFSIVYVVSVLLAFVAPQSKAWSLGIAFAYAVRHPQFFIVTAAAAVALWTIFSRSAASAAPRRVADVVVIFCIGVTALCLLRFIDMAVAFWSYANVADTLEFRGLGLSVLALAWPLLLVVMLWARPTRLLGIAASGAVFILWLPSMLGGFLAPFFLGGVSLDASPVMWKMLPSLLSMLLGVIVPICGLIAAIRTFFSYPGSLPQDAAVS